MPPEINHARNQRKTGGKQSNRLAEISDSIGNRREIEDCESVAVGSPVGQNELSVSIGSQTQPSEPIGDKYRITSLALKSTVCAGLGNDREKWLGCAGTARRYIPEDRTL
jgi:hypothetical protein